MTSTNSFLSLEGLTSSQVCTEFFHFAIIFQPFLPIVPGHLCVLPAARCQCPCCISCMGQKTKSEPHRGWAPACAEHAKRNCRALWSEALPLATPISIYLPTASCCRTGEVPAQGCLVASQRQTRCSWTSASFATELNSRCTCSAEADEPCSLQHPRPCICSASFGRRCLTHTVVYIPGV